MDLRGVRSLKTKWVQNTSPEVMNSVFPKANFFWGHPVFFLKLKWIVGVKNAVLFKKIS